MISEPELVGEDGEIPPPADVVAPPDPPPPRARRPWLWALGGALVASAVWAGTLHQVTEGPATDLRGYALPDDLCTKATLTSLGQKYGRPKPQHRAVREHPALDRAWCDVQLGEPAAAGDINYALRMELALHKKADPQEEFEVLATQSDWAPSDGVVDHTKLSGLGEQALYIFDDTYSEPQLQVLDGGVVLRMTFMSSYEWQEGQEAGADQEPDLRGVRDLMIEDMRELMASLRG